MSSVGIIPSWTEAETDFQLQGTEHPNSVLLTIRAVKFGIQVMKRQCLLELTALGVAWSNYILVPPRHQGTGGALPSSTLVDCGFRLCPLPPTMPMGPRSHSQT